MSPRLRFGRRLSIPSTRQIIHEMGMLQAEEERLKAASSPPDQANESPNADGMRLVQDRVAGGRSQ